MLKSSRGVDPHHLVRVIVLEGGRLAAAGKVRAVAILARALKKVARRHPRVFTRRDFINLEIHPYKHETLNIAGRIGAINLLFKPRVKRSEIEQAMRHGIKLFKTHGFRMHNLDLIPLENSLLAKFGKFDAFVQRTNFTSRKTRELRDEYLVHRKS